MKKLLLLLLCATSLKAMGKPEEWNFCSSFKNVNAVSFSPDSHLLAIAFYNEVCLLKNCPEMKTLRVFKNPISFTHPLKWITSVAFSPDRETLATGTDTESIRLWDIGTGLCTKILNKKYANEAFPPQHVVPPFPPFSSFDPESESIFKKVQDKLMGPSSQGGAAVFLFSPDGKTLIAGPYNRTFHVWRKATKMN